MPTSSAPTSASGSDSMMSSGSVNDSNCDARMMYIRITERTKAHRNSVKVFSISLALPVTKV